MCGIVPYGPLKNFSRPHIHSENKQRTKDEEELVKKLF